MFISLYQEQRVITYKGRHAAVRYGRRELDDDVTVLYKDLRSRDNTELL